MVTYEPFLVFVFCLMLIIIADSKVSDTTCTDGGTGCPTNSACVTGKCKCAAGFAEDTADGSTCVKVVSATDCNDNQGCSTTIPNSACDVPKTKCKCDTGFTEVANKCLKGTGETCTNANDCVPNTICEGSPNKCTCKPLFKPVSGLCVKKTVSEFDCSESITCTDSNSECVSSRCKCKNGFKEDAVDGSTCQKILGLACTSSTANTVCNIENSICNTGMQCECKSGYKEDGALCLKVLGSSCSGDTSCSRVTHAECAKDKCSCVTNYIEDSDVCRKELGQSCTDHTECVSNAECAKSKCGCGEGFEVSNGLCAKPSSSPKTSIAKLALCGSMLLSIYIHLF